MKKLSRTLDVKIEIVIRNYQNALSCGINNPNWDLVAEIFIDMLKHKKMLGKEYISDFMLNELWIEADKVAKSQIEF